MVHETEQETASEDINKKADGLSEGCAGCGCLLILLWAIFAAVSWAWGIHWFFGVLMLFFLLAIFN